MSGFDWIWRELWPFREVDRVRDRAAVRELVETWDAIAADTTGSPTEELE